MQYSKLHSRGETCQLQDHHRRCVRSGRNVRRQANQAVAVSYKKIEVGSGRKVGDQSFRKDFKSCFHLQPSTDPSKDAAVSVKLTQDSEIQLFNLDFTRTQASSRQSDKPELRIRLDSRDPRIYLQSNCFRSGGVINTSQNHRIS